MGSRLGWWSAAVLPGPLAIIRSFVGLVTTPVLLFAIAASMKLMLIGYGLAIVLGMPFGILIHQTPWLRTTLGPALLGLQTLPSVCWLPLALVWFGVSLQAVLFVVLGNSVFAIAVATAGALRQVSPQLIQAGQTLGARGWSLMSRVLLPAAYPDILTGLRLGWTFAWRALMAGELIVPQAGLGQVLQAGRASARIADILATMLVIMLLGLLVEVAFFTRLERTVRRQWGRSAT
jgi:NitT/TauT family transport system permease protein